MALFSSTGDWSGRFALVASAPRLQRLGVAAVVVAAHVVIVLALLAARAARHQASGDTVVDISFFPLPITPEERTQKVTPSAGEADRVEREREFSRSGETARVASASAPLQGAESSLRASQSPRGASDFDSGADSGSGVDSDADFDSDPKPDAPRDSDAPSTAIDWQAQLSTAAAAMEARGKAANERRSFSGPPPHTSLTPKRKKPPPCPFEACEPGWGSAPSVFDSTATKKGRIEKNADGEVIRWTSDYCYQILITSNEFHRAMTRCFRPLGKQSANGHLFDHMRDVPMPEERATDVP